MSTISAPGKLLLFGEHAVVYGYPCIVTAVDQRMTVSMDKRTDGKIVVNAPDVKDTRFVDTAIAKGIQAWGIAHEGLTISTKCSFSGCYGFGSSSAVTVATLFALAELFQKSVDKKELFRVAYDVVLSIQGVGSGFDIASAIYGGTIEFVKGGEHIEVIPWEQDGSVSFVVGYSGVKADTAAIVKDIAKKREQYTERVDRIFTAIGELVGKAKTAILEKDWAAVGKFMNFNQEFLRDLGVSTEKLESMILAAKKAGAYGAKLSGAGGGDCMIALVPTEKKEAVEKAITDVGGEVVPVGVNASGVGMDTTDDVKEEFIVVDDDDNILGYKSRYECHHNKNLLHRVVGIVVYDSSGRILLQKRSMTKDLNPGYWAISAAGHVGRDELNEVAAARELKEEIGVSLPLTHIKKFIIHTSYESEMASVYKVTFNGPFQPDPREVSEVKFFSKSDLTRALLSGDVKLTEGAMITLKEIGFL